MDGRGRTSQIFMVEHVYKQGRELWLEITMFVV